MGVALPLADTSGDSEAAVEAREYEGMKVYQLDAPLVAELNESGFQDTGSVQLADKDGDAVGVLLSADEYLLLSAAAELACDPDQFAALLKENERFQEGDQDDDVMTADEFETALRGD